ncbi:hypothetical protein HAX54_004326, partial [Datura stramonium]|nr:hypothetical protein [Datura stramonium]
GRGNRGFCNKERHGCFCHQVEEVNEGPSAYPISEGSEDVPAPPMPSRLVSSTSSGLLKLAQMAHDHIAQLVKLAKAIPPMIQYAIKIAMKPVMEKLGSLSARVDVLENESPDDWYVRDSPSGDATTIEMHEDEHPHNEVSYSMDDAHQDDPYWVAPIYSYHQGRTLLDRWVVASPYNPFALPPDLLMPSMADIVVQHFS